MTLPTDAELMAQLANLPENTTSPGSSTPDADKLLNGLSGAIQTWAHSQEGVAVVDLKFEISPPEIDQSAVQITSGWAIEIRCRGLGDLDPESNTPCCVVTQVWSGIGNSFIGAIAGVYKDFRSFLLSSRARLESRIGEIELAITALDYPDDLTNLWSTRDRDDNLVETEAVKPPCERP